MPDHPEATHDVTSEAELRSALTAFEGRRELAVDVEADSMHAFHPRLCFVQIANESEIFLLDTLQPGVAAERLAPSFGDPEVTKYFHAAGGDLQYLAEAGVRVKGLFDTHRAATLLGWPKVGLADLVRERLGHELQKEHQQADFSQRPLPPELRCYIADDVRYLGEIGRQVVEACREAEILEEVLLDCQRLSDEAVGRPEVAGFRPKLQGTLTPKERALSTAIARALHEARLAWAEAADVPMGRMLSNAAIAAIASKPPTNTRELVKREGVRGAFVREHGEEAVALVREHLERARRGELPTEEPRPRSDPDRKKREEALRAFRAEQAKVRKVTPSVVLPNPLVEALSASPPAGLEELGAVPYLGEKRVRLYGEALLELLART